MKRLLVMVLIMLMVMSSISIEGVSFAETSYSDLIISEYVEYGNTKAIEIFNGTTEAVTLSEYQLNLYSNGKNTVSNSKPLGTDAITELASGEVLVIAGTSTQNALKDIADYTSSVINFNGNDGMVLLHNGVVIDSIGDVDAQIDDDSDDGNFGENKTYSKKVSIKLGDTIINDQFDENIWDSLGGNVLDNVGSYEGTVNQPQPTYTDLLITEYVEGSGQNKALEIYNGTSQTMDLSEYTLELYANTNTTPNTTLTLDAGTLKTLAPNDLLVVVHGSADSELLAKANITHHVASFNGNDEIALKHNGVLIDSLGRLGDEDVEYGKNTTLRRSLTHVVGDTDLTDVFSLDGWTTFAEDTFDDLGQYNGTVTPPTGIDLNIPDGFDMAVYYNDAAGLTGNALKAALNDIITAGHTPVTYGQAYDALYHTDHSEGPVLIENFNASANNQVKLFYSGELRNGPDKYSANWNREHVWAKSHGDFGTSNGPGSDLHQLRPTDVSINSKRGHLDFDYSDNDYLFGNKVDGDSWEPRDEVKGDVARALFYMAVRYEGEDYLDLELSESLDSISETTSGYGEHGKLSVLLQWHQSDPVSDWEISRNNVIYTDYQHNRNPFIDHPEYAQAIFGGSVTPGNGQKIYDIQGNSHTSPLNGQAVEDVRGIVTAKLNYKFDMYGSPIVGFYMQDPTGDNNVNTSDGIFVLSSHDVAIGDLVSVNGQVKDYVKEMDFYAYDQENQLSVTSIQASHVQVVSSNNTLPDPIVLGQNGRVVPHNKVSSSNFSVYDPSQYAIDFYESLEGMRIKVENPLVVGPYINRVIGVVPDNGTVATSDSDLSILNGNLLNGDDNNTETLLINGAMSSITSAKYIQMGATFDDHLVGILDYEWTNYQMYITESLPSYTQPTVERQSFKYETSDDELTIASYNVYNHAANDAQSKTDGIASQIVYDMKSPDIIGLCEVQDNNGTSEGNVTDASLTYQGFIDAIVAAGGPTYAWTDIEPVAGQEGGAPKGNIRVGYLYNPARVSLVPGVKGSSTQTVSVDNEGHLTLNPGRVAATASAFDNTRKSLAAEFEFNGENIIVIMNHLKSKGGDNGVFGNVQLPVLSTEVKRTEQAQLINDFVDDIVAKNSQANVVVMGDMNDYQYSAPLTAMKGDVLTNMVDELNAAEQFSYTYNGNAQVLDHILVSNHLVDQTKADFINVNSLYGKDDKQNKHSDHDPMMVVISNLQGQAPDVYPAIASAQGEVAVDTAITLTTTTAGADIYYSVDKALNLDNMTANELYTAPIVIDQAKTIHTIAVKDQLRSSVKTYAFTIAPDVHTIETARQLPVGSDVILEVYATTPKGVKGGSSFFFQDATGGAYIHSQSLLDTVVEGMHLRLKGKTADYKGHFQISLNEAVVLDGPVVQVPKKIQMTEVGELYESQLIQLKDLIIDEINSDSYGNQKLTLSKDGKTIQAKLDSRLEVADFSALFAVGDQVTVTGLISEYEGQYSLTLKAAKDVEKITVISMAEAKGLIGSTDKVTVEGVVTSEPGAFGNQSFTFQDSTGGVYIYTKSLDVDLKVGSKIRMTGLPTEYKGLFQMTEFDIEVLGEALVQPKVISAGGLSENVESILVKIEDLSIVEITSDNYKNAYIRFKNGDDEFTARLDARSGHDVEAVKNKVAQGQNFTALGTVYQSGDKYTLSLRSIEDIIIDDSGVLISNVSVKNLKHEVVNNIKENAFFYIAAEMTSGTPEPGILMYKVEKENQVYRIGIVESLTGSGTFVVGYDSFGMEKGTYTVKAYYWDGLLSMKPLAHVKTITFEIE